MTSGKITKNDVGKTVYLSNSFTKCQEWRIADINHAGTSGTVDLFPKYVLGAVDCIANSSSYDPTYCRTQIHDALYVNSKTYPCVYNGFSSEVKNAMLKIKYPYYAASSGFPTKLNTDLEEYVVAPSLKEIGIDYSYNYPTLSEMLLEGELYPLFGSELGKSNPLAGLKVMSGDEIGYISRTFVDGIRYGSTVMQILYNGIRCDTVSYGSGGYAGFIRFGKQ